MLVEKSQTGARSGSNLRPDLYRQSNLRWKTTDPLTRRDSGDERMAHLQLLASGTAFIDVRAPVEYSRGAIPNAVNAPLMTDREREQIGITYKQHGQRAAIDLGHRLVAGTTRSIRIRRWLELGRQHPNAWLYCARGGLRSAIAQEWLLAEGVLLPAVPGGFKTLRNVCLRVLAEAPSTKHWLVIGGRTGAGKTELLRQIRTGIDLEALANHRGSAFGANASPQPSQVSFENALAVEFLEHRDDVVTLEDESPTIGRLALPTAWYKQMQAAPIVLLEANLEARCQRIEQEYVRNPIPHGVNPDSHERRLSNALARIRRRLGGKRFAEIRELLAIGFRIDNHTPWIERLLAWYYDPMYDYQLQRKRARIVFRGDADAVIRHVVEWSSLVSDRMQKPVASVAHV